MQKKKKTHLALVPDQVLDLLVQREFEGRVEAEHGTVDSNRDVVPLHAAQQCGNSTGTEVGGAIAHHRTDVGHICAISGSRVRDA